jgi:hypothetical protein
VFFSEPIVFVLGIIGLGYFIYRRQYQFPVLFALIMLFVYVYMASIILLPKHYLFIILFLIPLASALVDASLEKIKGKFPKFRLRYLAFAYILFMVIFLGINTSYAMTHFYGESAIGQAIEFKKSIPQNSLVVFDSRFYRGRINWMGYGKPYLEGSDFIQLANNPSQIPGTATAIDIYFFECVSDDCGWGSVSKQPDFNRSMEALVSFFSKSGALVEKISEPDRDKVYYPLISSQNKLPSINIYRARLPMNSGILSIASQPKSWFLYNIGYIPKGSEFDDYFPTGFFDILLDKFAHFVVWLSLITAFLSPIYIVYLALPRRKENEKAENSLNNNPRI